MDLGSLGSLGSHITWDVKFFTGILSIVLIDLVLAGDNAVVIAMAVRMLPKSQRFKGIVFGAGAGRCGFVKGSAYLFCLPASSNKIFKTWRRSAHCMDRGQAFG